MFTGCKAACKTPQACCFFVVEFVVPIVWGTWFYVIKNARWIAVSESFKISLYFLDRHQMSKTAWSKVCIQFWRVKGSWEVDASLTDPVDTFLWSSGLPTYTPTHISCLTLLSCIRAPHFLWGFLLLSGLYEPIPFQAPSLLLCIWAPVSDSAALPPAHLFIPPKLPVWVVSSLQWLLRPPRRKHPNFNLQHKSLSWVLVSEERLKFNSYKLRFFHSYPPKQFLCWFSVSHLFLSPPDSPPWGSAQTWILAAHLGLSVGGTGQRLEHGRRGKLGYWVPSLHSYQPLPGLAEAALLFR